MSTEMAVYKVGDKNGLVAKFADRFGVDQGKLVTTLKATAFKGAAQISDEQMLALLVVADQYKLNPWTKELYAFPDSKSGIVPVVGVDGWARIINEHPGFDGMDFAEGPADKNGLPEWVEATIYRKDRAHPIKVKEFMTECKRNTAPWQSHPRRMLRHKAMIQAARIAFGFTGFYDEDEAERIVAAPAAETPVFTVEAKPKAEPKKPEPKKVEAEVIEVVEVVEGAPEAPPAEPEPPAAKAEPDVPQGMKSYLQNKAKATGLDLAKLLADANYTTVDPATLAGLKESQFLVLKGILVQA